MGSDLFGEVEQDEAGGVRDPGTIELKSAVPVTLMFSPAQNDVRQWNVRVPGVGLIARVDPVERTAARFKDPWWQQVLSDDYLLARLALAKPETARRAR